MKINNKGFTMVEILAAVSILAILSGVAVSAVTKYQEKARQKAYQSMEQSAYSAAHNYILDKSEIIPPAGKTYNVIDLVDKGYLQRLEDPRAKGSDCHTGSTVSVKKISKTSTTMLDQYEFTVIIKCKNYTSTRIDDEGVKHTGVIFNS